MLSLVINTPFCTLPTCDTDYFFLEGREGLNIEEGVARLPFRRFTIYHPDSLDLVDKLGPENTLIFTRLLLSYFDSAYMLYDFTAQHIDQINGEISRIEIEKVARNYNVEVFNYLSVDQTTYLSIHNEERVVTDLHPNKNELQELLWSMNLEKILSSYNISFYKDRIFTDKEKNTRNFDMLVYKMLKNREVSMVMHTWRKLNSYSRPDFIANISNILEFIENDLKKNKKSFAPDREEFVRLESFIKMVCKTSRPYYFGLFNSSDLLGFFSRHGSNHLLDYEKISTEKGLSLKNIKKNMESKIVPNQEEIQLLFNFWHITTSIIVTLWFRTKKQN